MSTWAERLSSKRTSQRSTPIIAPSPDPRSTVSGLTPLVPDAPPFHVDPHRRDASMSAASPTTALATSLAAPATSGLDASPSPWSVTAHVIPGAASPSPHPEERGQTLAEIREEFRQQAEARNRDPMEVPFIHIPLDCWEWVTAYIRYTDVMHLASTCRRLWVLLRYRDSLWEQQLRFFHEEMQEMRGGALLLTKFAVPPHATLFGYEWFLRERQLYVRDARREWHFKEFTQLDDRETGSFTVAIHEGADARESAANAPLSRPRDDSADDTHGHFAAAALQSPTRALSSTRATPTTAHPAPHGSPSPQQAPPIASGSFASSAGAPRRVGEPLMLSNVPPLTLTVERPLRTGENARDFVYHDPNGDANDEWAEDWEGEDEGDWDNNNNNGNEEEDYGSPATDYRRLQESTGMTEEELLQYVLALSQAEAEEAAAAAAVGAGAEPHTESSSGVPDSRAEEPARKPTPRPPHLPTLAAPLKPSELMTLIDFINHGNVENSRREILNITDLFNAQCGPVYANALAETLRSTMRRRLHFESHHRALLNNGETRRHRLGRPERVEGTGVAAAGAGAGDASAGEELSQDVVSANASLSASPSPPPPTSGGSAGPAPDAAAPAPAPAQPQPARRLQASDIPGGYPVNKMFRQFTGKLLEVSRQEAQLIATQLLGKPELLDDFCVFPLKRTPTLPRMRKPLMTAVCDARRQYRQHPSPEHGGVGSGEAEAGDDVTEACEDVMPPQATRFFLAPELCMHGRVGLILADPVRVLVVVAAEKVTRDDPTWAGPLRVERTGRVYTPGQSYNAQYYEIDEARGRFV